MTRPLRVTILLALVLLASLPMAASLENAGIYLVTYNSLWQTGDTAYGYLGTGLEFQFWCSYYPYYDCVFWYDAYVQGLLMLNGGYADWGQTGGDDDSAVMLLTSTVPLGYHTYELLGQEHSVFLEYWDPNGGLPWVDGLEDSTDYEMFTYDQTPVISSIDPDTWDAGQIEPVSIYGSGFGSNPSVDAGPYVDVSVDSVSDEYILASMYVYPDAPGGSVTVTVTSQGANGQNFMPAPGGGGASTSGTVTVHAAPPTGCGDQQKDNLIAEYYTYGVTWKPSCSDVAVPWGTTNFWASEINRDNEYRNYWTITKDIMPTGLEEIRAAAGNLSMPVSSGYRNPAHNYNMVPRGAQNSRHMYGDAADITETNTARRNLFKWTLGPQYEACVEDLNKTDTWVHFDWRGSSACPPDGQW